MGTINLGQRRFSGMKNATLLTRVPAALKVAVQKLRKQLNYEDDSSFIMDLLIQYIEGEIRDGRFMLDESEVIIPPKPPKKKSK